MHYYTSFNNSIHDKGKKGCGFIDPKPHTKQKRMKKDKVDLSFVHDIKPFKFVNKSNSIGFLKIQSHCGRGKKKTIIFTCLLLRVYMYALIIIVIWYSLTITHSPGCSHSPILHHWPVVLWCQTVWSRKGQFYKLECYKQREDGSQTACSQQELYVQFERVCHLADQRHKGESDQTCPLHWGALCTWVKV